MPLIYSFVARDTTVLAEYTPYSGNFNTVAIECLQRLNNPESKFTIACDRHTFNFLVHNGFSESPNARVLEVPLPWAWLSRGGACHVGLPAVATWERLPAPARPPAAYLVVADEEYGRQVPFAFLERVRDEFEEKFAEKGRTAAAHSMDRTFG